MPLPRFAFQTSQQPTKISLPCILVASFVVQIVAAVGIVGYLSFRNGERAVEELAQKLIAQTGKRVEEKLTTVLENTHWVNQLNAEAIDRTELNLQLGRPQPRAEKFLSQQMRAFKSIQWISLQKDSRKAATGATECFRKPNSCHSHLCRVFVRTFQGFW